MVVALFTMSVIGFVRCAKEELPGPQGEQGVQGTQGEKGDKGDAGANGADGANGTNGANGQDGEDAKEATSKEFSLTFSQSENYQFAPVPLFSNYEKTDIMLVYVKTIIGSGTWYELLPSTLYDTNYKAIATMIPLFSESGGLQIGIWGTSGDYFNPPIGNETYTFKAVRIKTTTTTKSGTDIDYSNYAEVAEYYNLEK